MKNLFVLLLIAFVATSLGLGQTIPAAAKTDFANRFPDAANAKWEKEGKLFEAHFKENGASASAEYDLKGKWLTTERRIAVDAIPNQIMTAIKAKYPAATFLAAETVLKGQAPLQYEVLIKNQGKMTELLTDANGKILKSVQEKGSEGSEGSAEKAGNDGSAGSDEKK